MNDKEISSQWRNRNHTGVCQNKFNNSSHCGYFPPLSTNLLIIWHWIVTAEHLIRMQVKQKQGAAFNTGSQHGARDSHGKIVRSRPTPSSGLPALHFLTSCLKTNSQGVFCWSILNVLLGWCKGKNKGFTPNLRADLSLLCLHLFPRWTPPGFHW